MDLLKNKIMIGFFVFMVLFTTFDSLNVSKRNSENEDNDKYMNNNYVVMNED